MVLNRVDFPDFGFASNYTPNEWRRCKTTLETSEEDVKSTLETSGEDRYYLGWIMISRHNEKI
jgi:hypothetical protein